jgi:hypothetical protein
MTGNLLNHLVGGGQQDFRDGKADRPGGPEAEDEFDLGVRRFTLESSKVCYQHDAGCLQLRRRVMTKLIFLILLSVAAARSVQAGDTKDSLRDVMDVCNQFVINDPDPGMRLDYHNCDIYDDRDAAWR